MISQFFSNGFAIYVTWQGDRGRDNHGYTWIKKDGFAIGADGVWKFKI